MLSWRQFLLGFLLHISCTEYSSAMIVLCVWDSHYEITFNKFSLTFSSVISFICYHFSTYINEESKFSDKVSKKLQDNIVSLISLSYKIWIKIFSSIILSSQVHSYFSTLYEVRCFLLLILPFANFLVAYFIQNFTIWVQNIIIRFKICSWKWNFYKNVQL